MFLTPDGIWPLCRPLENLSIFSCLHLTSEGKESFYISIPGTHPLLSCWNGYFLSVLSEDLLQTLLLKKLLKRPSWRVYVCRNHLPRVSAFQPLGRFFDFPPLSSFSESGWAIQLVSPARPLVHFPKGVLGKLETQKPPWLGCQGLIMLPQDPQHRHSYCLSQRSRESYVPLLLLEFVNSNRIFVFFVTLEKSVLIHRNLIGLWTARWMKDVLYCILKLLHLSLPILWQVQGDGHVLFIN